MSYHNILSLFSSLQININILYTKTWYRLQVWVHESHTWKSIIYLHWRKGYTLFFPTKKVLPDIIRIILSKKKKKLEKYTLENISRLICLINEMQNLTQSIQQWIDWKMKIKFLFVSNCLEVNFCILPIVLNNNVNQRRPNYLSRERIPKFFLEKGQF